MQAGEHIHISFWSDNLVTEVVELSSLVARSELKDRIEPDFEIILENGFIVKDIIINKKDKKQGFQ